MTIATLLSLIPGVIGWLDTIAKVHPILVTIFGVTGGLPAVISAIFAAWRGLVAVLNILAVAIPSLGTIANEISVEEAKLEAGSLKLVGWLNQLSGWKPPTV